MSASLRLSHSSQLHHRQLKFWCVVTAFDAPFFTRHASFRLAGNANHRLLGCTSHDTTRSRLVRLGLTCTDASGRLEVEEGWYHVA
jgi:hypothetical protein